MVNYKKLFRKANIEIFAVCKNCNTHWCTLEENKIIKECENCKSSEYMENYCNFDDVLEYLKKNIR